MFRVTSRGYFAAVAFVGALVMLGTARICAQQKPAAEEPAVDMQWAVKIPMRDGVKLNATVFMAHGQKESMPAIFTFTPYIGDSYTDRAVYFAKHGYAPRAMCFTLEYCSRDIRAIGSRRIRGRMIRSIRGRARRSLRMSRII